MEDNDIIQKFILYNIPDNDINKDYETLLDTYKNINWNQFIVNNNKKEICIFREIDDNGFVKILELDVDCQNIIFKESSPITNDKYIIMSDMVFQKLFQPKNGKEYGLFGFITLYKVLMNKEKYKLAPLISREIIYNGTEIKEAKPIYYGEENYQNIESMEYKDILKRVLTKNN